MDKIKQQFPEFEGKPSPNFRDLSGSKIGRLEVLYRTTDYVSPEGNKGVRYVCRCDCGTICVVPSSTIRRGTVCSCGCYRVKVTSERSKTHGISTSSIYYRCKEVFQRCNNPNCTSYPNYGGRGITCEFDNVAEMIEYLSTLPHYNEDGYSIDRIDNNGNYARGNLRWANKKEQGNNTRANVRYEFDGWNLTLSEWEDIVGIPWRLLHNRIHKHGWTVERALTQPLRKYR